jgi:glycerophosphoryl diester phosphodiesterase
MNLFLQPRPAPLVLAHRGASMHAPENTLAAFQLAADQGADGIELDAKLTRDGSIVVMHDATVDRTTDGHGRVSDLTLSQIKVLKIKRLEAERQLREPAARALAGALVPNKDFVDEETVPLLEEVFDAVASRLIINIELTNYTSRSDGLERKVIDLIKQHDQIDRVMVSSFNPFSLRKVKSIEPRIVCGLLYSPDMPIFLRRAWLAPIIPHLEAHHPHYQQVTSNYVARLHSHGKKINVWTVNDRAAIQAAIKFGVNGIMGDDPVLIRTLLAN